MILLIREAANISNLAKQSLSKGPSSQFAAICTAEISAVPSLDDFLNGRNVPATKRRIEVNSSLEKGPAVYIGPFPVLDALDFEAALDTWETRSS